jgi:hypothetical protein
MRMFDNRVLKKILGPKRKDVKGTWKNCVVRSFIICTPHQISYY